MISFLGDQNSLVKEISLLVIFKIIETYKEIEDIIRPADLMTVLLDEIKLRRPAATVKGAIWQLVGLLHSQYPQVVSVHMEESQDVQYQMLQEQVRTKKPEIKAIMGMLKGFCHSFEIECTLNKTQKEGLFLVLTTLSQPIEDVNNKGVLKAAMKLLSQHAHLFTDQIMSQSMTLIERALQLCTFENIEVRDAANDLLGSIIKQISDNIQADKDDHIRLFKNILHQFDEILHSQDYKNIQLLSAIRAVGIFSKAIKNILGDERLWEYLQSLNELSEAKLIKEFMNQDKPESDLQNFKYILKKQKQLIAYIESYSFIIRNVNKEPSEAFLLHFMKVGSIGVNNHRKLYAKYRFRFYDSLAQLTMSLTGFKNSFTIWIRKFVRQSLTETLKIPDSVIFGGESPAESLQDAVMFWKEYLCKDTIWSEASCRQVYDEIIGTCIHDIEQLDLNYKINRIANVQSGDQDQFDSDLKFNQSSIEYIANNNNDQQYLVRLTNFLEKFLPICKDQWFIKWIPRFSSVIVKKATTSPRIPKLYVLLKTVIQISSKHQYFEKLSNFQIVDENNESEQAECRNTFNMMLTFLKELTGKQEEFQDELLETTLSLLLNVPVVIIYQQDSKLQEVDNLHLWKGVMIKALVLAHLNNRLAVTCINTLEKWFNVLPVRLVAELYSDILPKLSDFLQIQSNQKQDTYFFQALIQDTKEERIERSQIANKVLDLLGKIGGHAHSIINNELTKQHDKDFFIRWDSDKRLKFSIPMNLKKIEIYLDSCLPRIIDLAQNSSEKKTRIAACELLHALILYMIGKSATKPKGHQNTKKESEDMAAFAKLYAKLFPVIIRLATEIEQISRQLFEPLVFQIVRWFSSSKIYEHPEVESLLDALIEGTQSRNNSALREMCSNAVAVFAKWSLKQMSDSEIQENPSNIKSLLRRIESNSNHPDPFKRLSSVLCFSKIVMVVKDYDSLIDRFLLEISRCVLISLKQCHNSLEFSQDVIENCGEILGLIQKLIIVKSDLLFKENQQRTVHFSLYEFLDFLFSKFTAVETVFRREAIKLWEGLVINLPKRLQLKGLILTKYVPEVGQKAIFWNIQLISFQSTALYIESKKQEYLERQKQMDTLSAQLEFIQWLIKVAKFQYVELQSKLRLDLKTIKQNIQTLLYSIIKPEFQEVVKSGSLSRLLTCEEDQEQLTKSKLRLLTEFFILLEQLTEGEIADFVIQSEPQFLLSLAVQILLVPSAHKLNLLVQDYQLEKRLRQPCEAYIRRTLLQQHEQMNLPDLVYKLAVMDLPQINLNKISELNSNQYHPRLLTNLLLGYLKLGQMCAEIQEQLQEISQQLAPVVESWISSDTPSQVESGRLLVSFMAQLQIPNETLSEWLTTKSQVFHKANDVILKYIADNWIREDIQLGNYLIEKTNEKLDLLYVFVPILEYISQKTPGYQKVLIQKIPNNWNNAAHDVEYAEKQVQVYSIIVQKCEWAFTHSKDDNTFINFVIQQAKNFLQSNKFSIYFQKQVLHLVGLLYSLNLPQAIHPKLKPVLEQFLTKQSPVVSRDLEENKNQIANYEKLLESFFDLLDLSKSIQILQILKRILSEHKPKFLSERIKASVNNFVLNVINAQPTFQQFYQIVSQQFESFFDNTHLQIQDNYRWAVAHKIINKILENCQLNYLEELFVKVFQKLKNSLISLAHLKGIQLYTTIREQTHVMLMLEIFVRRLDAETLKTKITQQIYGPEAPQNELLKYLIEVADDAKKERIPNVEERCQFFEQIILPELNGIQQVTRRYSCAAYTLLSSTILKTQTKQSVYTNYLFGSWDILIDNNPDLYQFSVQTNFNTISLQSIEQKSFQTKDIAKVKSLNLLNEYVTSSFMATNSNFNSAMVFETQLDQVPINQPDQESVKVEQKSLELDQVNGHECMKNIKRVLDRMENLFKQQWAEEGADSLPPFIQILLKEIDQGNFNLQVFILKLLVNNKELFQPYAQFWLKPVCNFITQKNTGGKGFHYFIRDLTTLLIVWSDSYKPDNSQTVICSKVINTLIRLAADKQKIIFNINIEIIAMLIHKWRSIVIIDKDMLIKMMSVPDQQDGSHLWKMTAIQMVALACTFDIPITNNQNNEFQKFQLDQTQPDPLLIAMLKLQELKKKQIIFASSEALGKVFSCQPGLAAVAIPYIMQNDAKERHDIIVNVIERITRDFPSLVEHRKIFLKLRSYINVMTGSMRGAIFKTFARYFSICSKQDQIDIYKEIHAISENILADISEENQKSFLILLSLIVKQDRQAGKELLTAVAHKLKNLFVNNKSEHVRELFYDLMAYLFDKFDEFKVQAKSALIRGLSDPSEQIRSRIVEYWNSEQRLNNDPVLRSEQLLSQTYDQEEEQSWLNNSVFLLLQTSKLAADFNLKIFDEPLQHCQFDPMHINQFKMNNNRSQPITPSLAQMAMISASQILQKTIKKQNTLTSIKEEVNAQEDLDQDMSEEINENTQNQISQERLKVAGGTQDQIIENAFAPGFIRATQQAGMPLFNPSQLMSSSLVITGFKYQQLPGNSNSQKSDQDYSFSQAFYDPGVQKQKGLKIFQLKSDEDKEHQQPGQQFQEPVFIAPPLSKPQQYQKPQADRSKFFEMNYVSYNPIQESQNGAMIRMVKDGSTPSQLARQEEIRMQQQKSLMKNLFSMQKQQISMLREYRVGEIPDIQIAYKDLILPLMALVQMDSTIATEVLVELFTQMYKDCKDIEQRKRLGAGVSGILSQSIKFDYGMINTMHRIAIELLKIDGFQIDADVIERTGRSSLSYQTSILLLEETIIFGKKIKELSQPKIVQKAEVVLTHASPVTMFGKVTSASKNYWFSLIQLYELVSNEDALKGIWCSIGESQSVMLKDQVDLSQSTYLAANLIRQAQSFKQKGEIKNGLKVLESVLSSPEFDQQFEDQVKLELLNKKYESFAELLRWDNIADMAIQQHDQKQLFEIPFLQAETMIRAQLRCESKWQNLNLQMQLWQNHPISKVYLERRFNYEQAMIFVTARDFDRARFYINREANDLLAQWKDLTKLSSYAQHILVQKIQKIYEMKEFLNTMKQLTLKNYDELAPEALQQIANWVQRQPSFSFDKLSVWDDILTSRMLFIDLYKFNFKQGSSFVNQLESDQSKFQDVQNIAAKLYVQIAKGALKMGLYDSCDKYLMTGLEQRSKTKQKDNLRIVVPIIKLKTEQFKQETLNLPINEKYQKLDKVLRVIDDKINNAKNIDQMTQIKAFQCKQNLHKKFINILYKDIVKDPKKDNIAKLVGHIQFAFTTNGNINSILFQEKLQIGAKQEVIKAKTFFNFSKLCHKILKQMENQTLCKPLQSIGQNSESLAILTIKNAFAAINLGYQRARDLIPRLLDIVGSLNSSKVDASFQEASKATPAWVFLRWISQLAAEMNRPKSEVIAEKVKQIQRKYPQALFYPFKVLESNLNYNILDSEVQVTQLFKRIQLQYEKNYQNLIDWTEALENLVHPEHRLASWIDLIEDVAKQAFENIKSQKVSSFFQMMIQDIANPKQGIGSYNLKFAQKWLPFLSQLGKKNLKISELINNLQQIKDKVEEYQLGQGEEKLSVFSDYLSDFDNNDFYNSEVYIEIPGQYEKCNSEPILGKNVKIACLRKSILILASIRRPKRITVHGSNEKDYHLLIKGGEDLRLDQRVQQLFEIMNTIFKEDAACQSRDLNLKTFNVVPITNRLGSLQWIDNTEPLKQIINREHIRADRSGRELHNSLANQKFRKFLQGLPDNKGVDDIRQQHLALLMLDTETCVTAFNTHKKLMQWSLLRQGLENLCLTSSAFITIKNQFVKSIAVFSIASYLLGIGDRHSENFLISTTDGEVLGIDYGCAFGSGVQLAVPELVPFRLTQQIEGVIAPHPMEGVYKQTMVQVLNALRKRKSVILETCDIFVKEPLLDWVSNARQKIIEQYGKDRIQRDEELLKLSFYPKNKIQILKDKLNGANPVRVVHQELQDSKHNKRPYYNRLLEALQGPEGGVRERLLKDAEGKKQHLDVETQVDCLIELARCPDILGRAWIGWGAYI